METAFICRERRLGVVQIGLRWSPDLCTAPPHRDICTDPLAIWKLPSKVVTEIFVFLVDGLAETAGLEKLGDG